MIVVCKVSLLTMNAGNKKAVAQQALQKEVCLNDSCPRILTQPMFLTDGEKILLYSKENHGEDHPSDTGFHSQLQQKQRTETSSPQAEASGLRDEKKMTLN